MPKLFPVCKCRVADNHRTQKNNKSIDQRLSIRLQLPEAMADDALVAYSIARIAEKGIRRDGSAGIWATAVRAREVQAVRRESVRFLLFGITASLVTILLYIPKQIYYSLVKLLTNYFFTIFIKDMNVAAINCQINAVSAFCLCAGRYTSGHFLSAAYTIKVNFSAH